MSTSQATELEAATADHSRVLSDLKAAADRFEELRRWGRTESGDYIRKAGVSIGEFDSALLAREALRREETEAKARLTRAQAAAAPAPLTREEYAAEALAKHAAAVEAFDAAEVAFAARDRAYDRAGSPGRPWATRFDLGSRTEAGGGLMTLASISNARIKGFDLSAVQKIADGLPAAPAPQRRALGPDEGTNLAAAFDAPAEY